MISVEHNLKFVTEFDETNPIARRVLSFPKKIQIDMLEELLKELLAPALKSEIDRINENGTYAVLKIVN